MHFAYTNSSRLQTYYSVRVEDSILEVVGDGDHGSYEWVVRDSAGKVLRHSDSGYGISEAALRDGLIHELGLPSFSFHVVNQP